MRHEAGGRFLLALLFAGLWSCGGPAKPSPISSASVGKPKETAPIASLAAPFASQAPADPPIDDERYTFSMVSSSPLGFTVHSMEGKLELRDKNHVLVLPLDGYERATFDETGTSLLAWNEKALVLLEVPSGRKIAEKAEGFKGKAAFLPGGSRALVLADQVGIRFYAIPSLQKTFEKLGAGLSEYHQTSRRAFLISDLTVPGASALNLKLFFLDTETEKIIGSISMNEAFMYMPHFATSADGKKLGWTVGNTSVWDTTTNRIIVLETGDPPEHPRYEKSAPYFSPDGNSVCVEQNGERRAISIRTRPKGTIRHCFFVGRAKKERLAEASSGDIESLILDVPVAKGWSHPSNAFGLSYRASFEALSPDNSLAAIVEEKDTKRGAEETERVLLIVETKTGHVLHRLPLSVQSTDTHRFDVEFTNDGEVVATYDDDRSEKKAFDVKTGKVVDFPAYDRFPPNSFEF